ncbi:MAG: hypothetical protein L0213_04840, partial [Candidatus Dadabacteria bacterium]|nr:hypothetical protein [Candidatus Dadabacteria bacterium]
MANWQYFHDLECALGNPFRELGDFFSPTESYSCMGLLKANDFVPADSPMILDGDVDIDINVDENGGRDEVRKTVILIQDGYTAKEEMENGWTAYDPIMPTRGGPDSDSDGLEDSIEIQLAGGNEQLDSDYDGKPNTADKDSDDDGLWDGEEYYGLGFEKGTEDYLEDGVLKPRAHISTNNAGIWDTKTTEIATQKV